MNPFVTANGKPVTAQLPCSLEEFLVAQKLLPRGNKFVVSSALCADSSHRLDATAM
jgi:hypothetical protein